MKSKLIIVFLVCTLFLTGFTANARGLGLKEAVKMAFQENIDLEIAELQLANAELDYRQTLLRNLGSKSRFVELQGELALIKARDNYSNLKNTTILGLYNDYFSLLQNQAGINLKEKQVELEKKKTEEVKAQVEVGYKGELDLFQQENKYQQVLFELQKMRDDNKQLYEEFKQKIGLDDENQSLKLVGIKAPVIKEVKEEKILQSARKNSLILKLREINLKLAQQQLKKAKATETPDLEMEKIKNNLKLAELQLEKEKQTLEQKVQQQYYIYKQAVKNIELTEQSLKQARENYQVIKEQHKEGLVSRNDLLAAEVSLLRAQNNRLAAYCNYYLNQLQLKQLMGLKSEVNFNVENE